MSFYLFSRQSASLQKNTTSTVLRYSCPFVAVSDEYISPNTLISADEDELWIPLQGDLAGTLAPGQYSFGLLKGRSGPEGLRFIRFKGKMAASPGVHAILPCDTASPCFLIHPKKENYLLNTTTLFFGISGDFEVEGRYINRGDALYLEKGGSVEIECLSDSGVLLLLSFYSLK